MDLQGSKCVWDAGAESAGVELVGEESRRGRVYYHGKGGGRANGISLARDGCRSAARGGDQSSGWV